MKFLVIAPIFDKLFGAGFFGYFFYSLGRLMDRVRVEVVACCTTVLVAFYSLATADVVYNNLGPGDMVAISGRILSGPDHDAFGNINR